MSEAQDFGIRNIQSRSDADWRDFLKKADERWVAEQAEEEKLRRDFLPNKEIPFPSPVTHPDIIIENNVDIPMRDGVILRGDIFRPKAEGRYPVVLQRTPYDKTSTLDLAPAVMRCLAQRGYVCINQDVRGRYASDGAFEPLINERQDGYETVEWAAAQSWSTGKVGMWGVSYAGYSSYNAAIAEAPHLACIYPAMIGCDLPFRDATGVFSLEAAAWTIWAGNPGKTLLNEHRLDRSHLPLCEIPERAGYSGELFKQIVRGDYSSPLAEEISDEEKLNRLSRIRAAVYTVCGWYDEVLTTSLETWRMLSELKSDANLLIGPYHHNLCDMEEARIGKAPTPDVESKRYYEDMDRFFAIHLKGETNELSVQDGPVKLFIMGANVWRTEQEWPLARAVNRELFFVIGGAASVRLDDGVLDWTAPKEEQPPDEYDYDPRNPVRGLSGYEIYTFLDTMGDRVEIESRDDVLVYTTAALDEGIEVTGVVAAVLYCSSDAPDTDFIVNLIDVHPDGHTQYLTHGVIRARYRNGVDEPELLSPGEVYRYEFKLRATSNLFKKGHRIRVEVTSSDFSHYPANQNVADTPGTTCNVKTAHQAVFHSASYPSHLILPVIPARD